MIQSIVMSKIQEVLNLETITLITPKHSDFGDFSIHEKSLHQTEDYDGVVQALSGIPLFESVMRNSGFINIKLSQAFLLDHMGIALKQQDSYGHTTTGDGKTYIIEHTSPNPNKAMHLGHLRNNILGMAIANIWAMTGIQVIRDCVDNNRGIAIAKLMWGYLAFARRSDSLPIDIGYWHKNPDEWDSGSDMNNPGEFIEMLYVKASEAYDSDPQIQEQIRHMVVDWEHEDEPTWALWKKVLTYSYQSQEKTLLRLGSHWDKIWHEHDHYKKGKQYVDEGLRKGVFKRSDVGTIITDLDAYKIPNTVLIKSDGTSLYITQDLALTDLKIKTYHPDKLFWVIGAEQSLAMKQMFAVCEQLEIGSVEKFCHLSYGFITLKNAGKMSSRKGNVIYIDTLLDNAKERAKVLIKKSKTSGVHTDDELEYISEAIGLGAVKYSLLKVSNNQEIAFDIDDSVSFEGNSGPYLQYTYTRLWSLLAKAGTIPTASLPPLNEEERSLLMHCLIFPTIIQESGNTNSPHLLCIYLYELTQYFNVLYEKHSILNTTPGEMALRIKLVQLTASIIKNGLHALGIPLLDRV